MTPAVALQRIAVVSEARSWLGTPYRHRVGIKRLGADCAYYLLRVFSQFGIVPPEYTPPAYPPGLALIRQGEDFYRSIILKFADPAPTGYAPQPGDVVLFKFFHVSHGGIVEFWPNVLHAFKTVGCVARNDVNVHTALGKRVDSIWIPRYDA